MYRKASYTRPANASTRSWAYLTSSGIRSRWCRKPARDCTILRSAEMTATRMAARTDERRRRVLVVDDEHTLAEIVSRYLERGGYDVRQAFDGPHAVGAATSW